MQHSNRLYSMQNLILLAYFVLITLSPSIHFIPYIEFHDCQRIIQLLLLSLILINSIYVSTSENSTRYIDSKFYWGGGAIFALAVASTASSVAPRYAVIEMSIFTSLCFLALWISKLYEVNKTKFIKQLVVVLWASILLYMLSFYVGYITAMSFKKTLVWPYPFFGFSNIRFFQQYQLGALGLICLPLLAFDLKKNHRIILHIALIFWWVLLFYAASRGSAIAWLVAILATAIVYRKLASSFIRVQLFSTAAGFVAYLFLFKGIPAWIEPTGDPTAVITTGNIFRVTTSDRLFLWNGAYEMIKNAPLLGVGPMQFPFHISFGTYPHNSLLLLASEWGLPATFIILAITCYGFYCWFNQFNPTKLKDMPKYDSNLAIVLFFSIIANTAYSLVSGVIVIPISQVLLFTIIGLIIGQYMERKPQQANKKTVASKSRLIPIIASVILLAMLWSTYPELKRGVLSYNRAIGPHDRAFALESGTINPRIWMQQRPMKQRKIYKK